jgi:hypothetical protein
MKPLAPPPVLHAAHAQAPRHWRNETNGDLIESVAKYLEGCDLTVRDLARLRAYFVQWVDSPVWDMNPHLNAESLRELATLRSDARRIVNAVCITAWVLRAQENGMNPL